MKIIKRAEVHNGKIEKRKPSKKMLLRIPPELYPKVIQYQAKNKYEYTTTAIIMLLWKGLENER